jgi:hypothetical protein
MLDYTVLEFYAGGLTFEMKKASLKCIPLNEIDKCALPKLEK